MFQVPDPSNPTSMKRMPNLFLNHVNERMREMMEDLKVNIEKDNRKWHCIYEFKIENHSELKRQARTSDGHLKNGIQST